MTRQRVYFIKPIGMDGPIKIGCSISPDGRRCTLEQWSPFPLEVVAEIEGDFGIERRFHAKFAACARTREWFDITPELSTTIEAIRAGTFDLADLPTDGQAKDYRRKRDLSFLTPAYRYRISVNSRMQHVPRERIHAAYAAIEEALGGCHWRAPAERFLERREAIEAVITEARKASL